LLSFFNLIQTCYQLFIFLISPLQDVTDIAIASFVDTTESQDATAVLASIVTDTTYEEIPLSRQKLSTPPNQNRVDTSSQGVGTPSPHLNVHPHPVESQEGVDTLKSSAYSSSTG
jgi:hypothetical protein